MKKYLYPFLIVVAFMVIQAMAGVAIFLFAFIKNPHLLNNPEAIQDVSNVMTIDSLAWAVILCDILVVVLIALMKMVNWKTVYNFIQVEWKWSLVAILGAVSVTFFLDYMNEVMGLPNLMENQFIDLSNNFVGILGIAVLGPICEELIFREAFMGYMLRNGGEKWLAIILSAVLFGVIHMNPAQILFASAIGLIYGLIYYKTGNVVVTSILHILNNSFSVVMMLIYGEKTKEMTLTSEVGTAGAIILATIGLAVCILCLKSFWKNAKTYPYEQDYPEKVEVAEVTIEKE